MRLRLRVSGIVTGDWMLLIVIEQTRSAFFNSGLSLSLWTNSYTLYFLEVPSARNTAAFTRFEDILKQAVAASSSVTALEA